MRLIATVLALSLCACVSDGMDSAFDFQALAGACEPSPVQIFVASTRRGGAESDGRTRFSLVSVSMPRGHRAGARAGAGFARAGFSLASRRQLDEAEFQREIAAQASGRVGVSRDILLYVHGYDISLDEARSRTAQLVADSGFSGLPALFAWDSNSRSGLAAYEADKESATVARDALEELLLDLAHVPGIGRVHILAHSMGCWLAMESLRGLAMFGHPDLDGRLGEVMLAAPDIDLNVFVQQASRVDAKRISLFVARDDRALLLSSRIAGGRPRLGAMDPSNSDDRRVLDSLGVSVHDLSGLKTDFIGHNTFAEAPTVVRQIGELLSLPPEEEAKVDASIDVSRKKAGSDSPSSLPLEGAIEAATPGS